MLFVTSGSLHGLVLLPSLLLSCLDNCCPLSPPPVNNKGDVLYSSPVFLPSSLTDLSFLSKFSFIWCHYPPALTLLSCFPLSLHLPFSLRPLESSSGICRLLEAWLLGCDEPGLPFAFLNAFSSHTHPVQTVDLSASSSRELGQEPYPGFCQSPLPGEQILCPDPWSLFGTLFGMAGSPVEPPSV